MGILDGILSILGLGSAGNDYVAQEHANQLNMMQTMMTNKQNLEIQKESWSREDNAVQRRVADLKAAGLNPMLAAGSAAASSGGATMVAPRSVPATMQDKVAGIMEMMRMKQDINQSEASTELVKAQKFNLDYNNKILEEKSHLQSDQPGGGGIKGLAFMDYQKDQAARDKALADAEKADADRRAAEAGAAAAQWDLAKAVERNQSTKASGIVRDIAEAQDFVNKRLDQAGAHISTAVQRVVNRFNQGRNK